MITIESLITLQWCNKISIITSTSFHQTTFCNLKNTTYHKYSTIRFYHPLIFSSFLAASTLQSQKLLLKYTINQVCYINLPSLCMTSIQNIMARSSQRLLEHFSYPWTMELILQLFAKHFFSNAISCCYYFLLPLLQHNLCKEGLKTSNVAPTWLIFASIFSQF